MRIRVNHDTGLFRVWVGTRHLGRFEAMETVKGRNGQWYIFKGERWAFVLARPQQEGPA